MTPNGKKIFKLGGLLVFFISISAYAVFISKDLLFGVKITNVNIEDGSTLTEKIIKVTGNAKNAINLTLDGREISIDQAGNFAETVALSTGYNIIGLRAEDKFGYVDEKNYQLIYKKEI